MRYLARYQHRTRHFPDYWRTFYADDLTEAQRIAERFARRGFIMARLTQPELTESDTPVMRTGFSPPELSRE